MRGLCTILVVFCLASAAHASQGAAPPRPITARLGDVIQPVEIDRAPARSAFAWWSRTTGIPLVVQWKALENRGIDPKAPVTLRLDRARAGRVLALMMRQVSTAASPGAAAAGPRTRLLYEATPWYVEVLTRAQANRRPILRVYDVRELVMTIPDFDNAPSFDLRQALSNTNSGGGGDSGGGSGDNSGGLFRDQRQGRGSGALREQSPRAQGTALVEAVRRTIEPTLWRAHGGEVASIRYYRGKLIVRAPLYVQRQIGTPRPPAAHTPPAPAASSASPAPTGARPIE